jgi:hypothetical protein
MADSFLQRLAGRLGVGKPHAPAAPELAVIVFGKHPAWNDHIPELGPEPARLVQFKQALYEGITGNIDNGQWEKLDKSGQLPPWGHSFLLTGGGEPVAARCWYSRDGLGRDRYPMIAAALCGGMPTEWIAREAFPLLQTLQKQCEAATSVEAVRAASLLALTQLRTRATAPAGAQLDAAAHLASRSEFDPHRTGLLRVIYHLEREYPQGQQPSQSRRGEARPVSLRVPPCADSAPQAAEIWSRFLGLRLNDSVSVLCIVPDDAQWLDAIVGPTDVSQLFCLRAPLAVLPFTSEIPYSLDPPFVAQTEKWIEDRITSSVALAPP